MTYLELIGCTLTAFGPSFVMFALTVVKDPIRFIILIASSFLWFTSFLISSGIWYFIGSKERIRLGLLISILIQEAFRYLIYRMLRKADVGIRQLAKTGSRIATNTHLISYVSGLGFGIASGSFAILNILAAVKGPGTMGFDDSPEHFSLFSSIFTMLFVLLNTFWSVIFYHGLDTNNKLYLAFVVISHINVSFATTFNRGGWYIVTVPFVLAITFMSLMVSYVVVGGSWSRFKHTLFPSSSPTETQT